MKEGSRIIEKTIKAEDLRPHPRVQRDVNEGNLKRIGGKNGEKLDLDALGSFEVVHYPIGDEIAFWVIDGQHRLWWLKHLGLGEWDCSCRVHVDVRNNARAAELARKFNDRAMWRPYDRYKIALIEGLEWAHDVKRIVEAHGARIKAHKASDTVPGISTLKRVRAMTPDNPGSALNDAIGTAVKSWGYTESTFDSKIIEGLGRVFATYNGKVDKPALVNKLSKFPGGAAGVYGAAKGMKQFRQTSVGRLVAETIVDCYNKGRREKLDAP